MATPFDSAGNEDLRTYIQNSWAFIAVVDASGGEVLRWDANNNASVTWTSGPASNPLVAELTVSGQDILDAGGSLPVTLTRTELYKSTGTSTRMATDPYTDATLEAPNDELTITHNIEIPPQ